MVALLSPSIYTVTMELLLILSISVIMRVTGNGSIEVIMFFPFPYCSYQWPRVLIVTTCVYDL